MRVIQSPLKWHGGKGGFHGKPAQWLASLMPSLFAACRLGDQNKILGIIVAAIFGDTPVLNYPWGTQPQLLNEGYQPVAIGPICGVDCPARRCRS
jgi:hypothetical protein